jgi:hypothetical protein
MYYLKMNLPSLALFLWDINAYYNAVKVSTTTLCAEPAEASVIWGFHVGEDSCCRFSVTVLLIGAIYQKSQQTVGHNPYFFVYLISKVQYVLQSIVPSCTPTEFEFPVEYHVLCKRKENGGRKCVATKRTKKIIFFRENI